MKKRKTVLSVLLVGIMLVSMCLSACGTDESNGKTVVELVQYKPEAVDVFEQLEEEFNATHDDILLKIESPNDATTILKTRFIREDYPDIMRGLGNPISI